MFGPRSNQSPESMMFGSNKLERGIIFVTVYVPISLVSLVVVNYYFEFYRLAECSIFRKFYEIHLEVFKSLD